MGLLLDVERAELSTRAAPRPAPAWGWNECLALGEDTAMQKDRFRETGRHDMRPRTRLALAAALITSAMAVPALGQSQEEYQAACQDDALRLCSEHISDHAKIRACLVAHKASISPACRAMLSQAPRKKRKQG
jgi:hypothetical protein